MPTNTPQQRAFFTWFRREIFKHHPYANGWFTAGQAARNTRVSIPTAKKYLFVLVGQGELETERRVRANGANVNFFRIKVMRKGGRDGH